MDAPQSRDDVDPIELAIRREIDEQLRIRWNPQSCVTRPGAFDAYGFAIGPKYEGRWEVVREIQDQIAVIYQLRWDGDGNEAYRAVGWWLLDFLRKWDRANQHWIGEMQRMYAEDDAAERTIKADAEAGEREHWERRASELAGNAGRESWFVTGFATPTPGDRSTTQTPVETS